MSTTTFEDDLEEFEDDIEDDLDDDRTLSGLTVLLMGLVVLGAIFTVSWMSYQLGARNSGTADRFVTADPEPVKIENPALADASDNLDREVYDRFNGETSEPVEVIAQAPEEPIDRGIGDDIDPITALVEANTQSSARAGSGSVGSGQVGSGQVGSGQVGSGQGAVADDAVADRIAALAAADETLLQDRPRASTGGANTGRSDSAGDTARTATRTTPASTTTTGNTPATASVAAARAGNALSGSHLVQVGAFRSDDEANGYWSRLSGRLGDFAAGKTTHIERADLGDRGIYYRLRIGPFASRDAAVTYCEGLKSRQQDCLVKAK